MFMDGWVGWVVEMDKRIPWMPGVRRYVERARLMQAGWVEYQLLQCYSTNH